MRKTLWLAAVLALLLSLTACSGGGEAPSPAVPEDQRQVTDASELEGKWSSPSGNILYFVADEGCYYYQTFSGRTGQGRYDTSGDVPMIDFDGFLYDFILRDDGVLLPNQNGSGDAESFDHFTFTRSDARVDIWDIAQLDGVWQNALGETLVIDSQRMEYLSYTRLSAGSGTIGDAGDGKGPYLAMDGFHAYISPGLEADRFALLPDGETNGDFSGVFYPYGQVAAYTALPGASFETDEDGYCRWYSDGHDAFYITGSYTLHEDGLAYRQDGPVYAAGFDPVDYDPAEDWGENWMNNWG